MRTYIYLQLCTILKNTCSLKSHLHKLATMENPSQLRKFQQSPSASPRLIRSRSASITPVSPDPLKPRLQASKLEKNLRSASKKTRKKSGEDVAPTSTDGFVRFLPNAENKIEVKRRTRSTSTSPSAWALSPGRSKPNSSPVRVEVAPLLPKSPASFDKLIKREGEGGGGVSGVLKYFSRQKKVSPVLEEEYHRFRVAYNRLLQWRFANARREASMDAIKRVAQRTLFNGWARISLMRNFIAEKRAKIQRLKHEIKMYYIFPSQMSLLDEWSKIEPKNVESVGRVVRKLSAVSLCMPLVHNAEADVISVKDAVLSAMTVMNDIQDMILDMHRQVERMCYLLTELAIMLTQQKQFLRELEISVTTVASLQAQEKILAVQHLQVMNELNESLEWKYQEFGKQ